MRRAFRLGRRRAGAGDRSAAGRGAGSRLFAAIGFVGLAVCLLIAPVGVLLLATPGTAVADPVLVGSSPSSGAVVIAPIDAIVLRFDRALRRVGVRVSLNGGPLVVPVPQRGADLSEAVIPVAGLPNGRYTVEFEATAADGSASSGQIGFTMRLADSAPTTATSSPPPVVTVPTPTAPTATTPTATPTSAPTPTSATPSATASPTTPGSVPVATEAPPASASASAAPASTAPGAATTTAPPATNPPSSSAPTTRRAPTTRVTTSTSAIPGTDAPVPASGTIAFPPTTLRRRTPTVPTPTTTPQAHSASPSTDTTGPTVSEPTPVPLDLRQPTRASSTPSTTGRLTLGNETIPTSAATTNTTTATTTTTPTTTRLTTTPTVTTASAPAMRGQPSTLPSNRAKRTRWRIAAVLVGVWLVAAIGALGSVFTRRRRRHIAGALRGFLWTTVAALATLAVLAFSRLRTGGDLASAGSVRVGATIAGAVAMLVLATLRAVRGRDRTERVLGRETPNAWWERWRARRVGPAKGHGLHTDVITRRLRVLTGVEVAFATVAIVVVAVLAIA